ncbi:hypothetical protein [Gulosibacter molinativorax]|uniref:DUF4397 domain-containing protein n=1 Tax=Gulosibacter molinativorax TaxID=256821 RepID=A0ABT7C5P6_9MICO|nr:hypothetical protein [Gulosibacter molinativorax]MDJ1370520.1 hypothetical protein [Gulosibacter molinativorax]QUY62069.1 Hypotetical protein [Gulosibacter molinativorax]
MGALIGALPLALVGCASAPGELRWEDVIEDRPFVELTTPLAGFESTPVDKSAANRVDTVSHVYRVESVHVSDLVTAEVLADYGFGNTRYEREIPTEGLVAPDGYDFAAARVTVDSKPYAPVTTHLAEGTVQLVVANENGSETYSISQPRLDNTFLFLVPEDAEPNDVVLEVTSRGSSQQLSLLDGSRVRSDNEEMYGCINVVGFVAGQDAYASATDEYGNVDELYAYVQSADLYPASDAYGIPESGQVFLRVQVVVGQSFYTATSPSGSFSNIPPSPASTASLRLDDGASIEAFAVKPIGGAGEVEIWFEIPNTLESGEFVADLSPYPRRDGLDEAFGDIALEASLSFTYDEGTH